MVNAACQKIRSNSGATMVISLVIFLIASIFSMVIVETAHSAMANAYDLSNDEQQYLLVSSGARLVQERIAAVSVEKTVHCTSTDGVNWSEGAPSYALPAGDPFDPFSQVLKQVVSENASEKHAALKTKADDAQAAPDEVQVTLEKKEGATVVDVNLYIARGTDKLYPITLRFQENETTPEAQNEVYSRDEEDNIVWASKNMVSTISWTLSDSDVMKG